MTTRSIMNNYGKRTVKKAGQPRGCALQSERWLGVFCPEPSRCRSPVVPPTAMPSAVIDRSAVIHRRRPVVVAIAWPVTVGVRGHTGCNCNGGSGGNGSNASPKAAGLRRRGRGGRRKRGNGCENQSGLLHLQFPSLIADHGRILVARDRGVRVRLEDRATTFTRQVMCAASHTPGPEEVRVEALRWAAFRAENETPWSASMNSTSPCRGTNSA